MATSYQFLEEELDDIFLVPKLSKNIADEWIKTIDILDAYLKIHIMFDTSIDHECLLEDEEIFSIVDRSDNTYFLKRYLYTYKVEQELTADNFPNVLLVNNDPIKKSGSLFENSSDNETENSSLSECKSTASPVDIWKILNELKSETTTSDTTSLNQEMGNVCKGCGGRDTFLEDVARSVRVCNKCGMENEELLDHNPEWRQYNNDDSRNDNVNRCGCPSNFFFPQSSQGTIMSRCGNSRLKRKQKWNTTVYKERNLTKEFDYITQICASNGISTDIIHTARIMYKKVSDARHNDGKNKGAAMIVRGENRISIMAVCVSKACETNKEPRSNEEIAGMFGLDAKKMTKGKNTLDKLRKKCMENDLILFDRLHVCSPEDYVRFHCKKLKITEKDTNMAVRISTNCCRMKIATDHNAQSVAASSILAMVDYQNLNIDKKDISKLSRTSEVTITKIYGKIVPYIEALVDNDATDHIIRVFKING
uniref:Transcription factor TFIIB cyclin-like domain-containing protein n=1 Tax=viral metagenome TaxID=1070528 RepID=A0A6C0CD67_9ZZZZ